jgi:hypothetical protein
MTRIAYRDKSGQLKLRVKVIEEVFHFVSFDDWVESAKRRFRNNGHTAESVICVDRNGMICTCGREFKIALYPVRVYAITKAPFEPTTSMRSEREPIA